MYVNVKSFNLCSTVDNFQIYKYVCNNIVICVHKMCSSTSNQAELLVLSQLKPYCSHKAYQDLVLPHICSERLLHFHALTQTVFLLLRLFWVQLQQIWFGCVD